jgi:alkylation response protein AidB-like acyl-CoA dehydrogenase
VDDLDITAVCYPWDVPGMQVWELTACIEERSIGKLEAIRFTDREFHFDEGTRPFVAAFDTHSLASFRLAEEVHERREDLQERFPPDAFASCGILAILSVRTEADIGGHRLALELIRYLKEIHEGLPWFACLIAAPMDMIAGTAEHRAMQARLIRYYLSDPALGFVEVGTVDDPGLLVAAWT